MGSSLTQGFNYVRLGEDTLTIAGQDLSISNIPSGYRFLILYVSAVKLGGGSSIYLRFNDDALNHYGTQYHKSTAGVITSNDVSGSEWTIMDIDTGYQISLICQINQYPITDDKGYSSSGGQKYVTYVTAGSWTSTAEINKITAHCGADMEIGSSMILYGVR